MQAFYLKLAKVTSWANAQFRTTMIDLNPDELHTRLTVNIQFNKSLPPPVGFVFKKIMAFALKRFYKQTHKQMIVHTHATQ